MLEVIQTSEAPQAVGAYSQAKKSGDLIFTSGQIGMNPENGEIIRGNFEKEARRVLSNLLAVVESGGGSPHSILKTQVFLTDLSFYETLNKIYDDVFSSPLPARSVVEVESLPKGVNVEIEAVASVT